MFIYCLTFFYLLTNLFGYISIICLIFASIRYITFGIIAMSALWMFKHGLLKILETKKMHISVKFKFKVKFSQ